MCLAIDSRLCRHLPQALTRFDVSDNQLTGLPRLPPGLESGCGNFNACNNPDIGIPANIALDNASHIRRWQRLQAPHVAPVSATQAPEVGVPLPMAQRRTRQDWNDLVIALKTTYGWQPAQVDAWKREYRHYTNSGDGDEGMRFNRRYAPWLDGDVNLDSTRAHYTQLLAAFNRAS